MPSKNRTSLTLPRALYSFVLLTALISSIVVGGVILNQLRGFETATLERAATLRTNSTALAFARALDQDWQHLQAIAEDFPRFSTEELEAVLSAAAGIRSRISWAGYADLSGTVRAASGGLLVSADVSARPWFQAGLRGDFAGDMHEALLLAEKMESEDEDPVRFLDLAIQVRDASGTPAGVIGFHINAGWVEDFLGGFAETLHADLFLVNQSGEVLVATDPAAEAPLHVLRAAAAGHVASGFTTWGDGEAYFTTMTTDIVHADLPSFGWRLVGRIHPSSVPAESLSALATGLLGGLVGAAALLMVLAMLFVRIFLRPVAVLARNAQSIASGVDEYPADLHRTAELSALSSALARLQGQRA